VDRQARDAALAQVLDAQSLNETGRSVRVEPRVLVISGGA